MTATNKSPFESDSPFVDPRRHLSVNPTDSWRFECPEGHHTLTWASQQTVECHRCTTNYDYVGSGMYSVEYIRDQKTGRTLAEFLEGYRE